MKPFEKQKAFGQNFLNDQNVIQKIVGAALDELPSDEPFSVLEIGPGHGAITLPILERLEKTATVHPQSQWIIVEKDREMADYWTAKLKPHSWIRFISADFLYVDLDAIFGAQKNWVIVSNLPYSSGTAILGKLIRHKKHICKMVLMFQKEVAQRISAERGTKAWGSLSLAVQNHWDTESVMMVPPRAFTPAPKVDSQVIELKPRTTARIVCQNAEEEVRLEKLWKLAFLHRRKMLRGALPAEGEWRNALFASGVDGTLRAEQLDWNDWEKLLSALRQ